MKSPLSSLTKNKRKKERKMIVMINGTIVGTVDPKEYSIKELEDAGFTVIVK